MLKRTFINLTLAVTFMAGNALPVLANQTAISKEQTIHVEYSQAASLPINIDAIHLKLLEKARLKTTKISRLSDDKHTRDLAENLKLIDFNLTTVGSNTLAKASYSIVGESKSANVASRITIPKGFSQNNMRLQKLKEKNSMFEAEAKEEALIQGYLDAVLDDGVIIPNFQSCKYSPRYYSSPVRTAFSYLHRYNEVEGKFETRVDDRQLSNNLFIVSKYQDLNYLLGRGQYIDEGVLRYMTDWGLANGNLDYYDYINYPIKNAYCVRVDVKFNEKLQVQRSGNKHNPLSIENDTRRAIQVVVVIDGVKYRRNLLLLKEKSDTGYVVTIHNTAHLSDFKGTRESSFLDIPEFKEINDKRKRDKQKHGAYLDAQIQLAANEYYLEGGPRTPAIPVRDVIVSDVYHNGLKNTDFYVQIILHSTKTISDVSVHLEEKQ